MESPRKLPRPRKRIRELIAAAFVCLCAVGITSSTYTTTSAAPGDPVETTPGKCVLPISPVRPIAWQNASSGVDASKRFQNVNIRLKPGTTDVVQVYFQYQDLTKSLDVRAANLYMNMPVGLQFPEKMIINNGETQGALHSIDVLSNPNGIWGKPKDFIKDHKYVGYVVFKKNDNGWQYGDDDWSSITYPNADGSVFTEASVGAEIRKNPSDRFFLWQRYSGGSGFHTGNSGGWRAVYYETKLEPNNPGRLAFGFSLDKSAEAVKGGVIVEVPRSQAINVHGYWDQPILTPENSGITDAAKIPPQGLHFQAQFRNSRGQALGVQEEIIKNGTTHCAKYPDGLVNYDTSSLKNLWASIGQKPGRKFYPLTSTEDVTLAKVGFNITKDVAGNTPADFVYRGSDRQQDGYLKSKDGADKFKIRYYIPKAPIVSGAGMDYDFRFTPYVLQKSDPAYPRNPKGMSPYKDLVKWFDFPPGVSDLEAALRANGNRIERDIIPGFLRARCDLTSNIQKEFVGTKIDIWAPGYYFADGARWLFGDDRYIGAHQESGQQRAGRTSMSMDCYAERRVTNADPKAAQIWKQEPLDALFIADAESTDGNGESLGVTFADSDRKFYPMDGFSSCSVSEIVNVQKVESNAIIGGAQGTATRRGNEIFFKNPTGRCAEVNATRNAFLQYGIVSGPSLIGAVPVNQSTPKTPITINMVGAGKQAAAFGVVRAGDTSNAYPTNAMPPVYQYSSLNTAFNTSAADSPATDWADSAQNRKNFLYYGSRLGARATSYQPNTKEPLSVKSGETNDALAKKMVAKSYPNGVTKDHPKATGAGITAQGATNMYPVDSNAKKIVDGKLVPIGKGQFSVNVACGRSLKGETVVRGWLDFNGNGSFDPGEESNVATCAKQDTPLSAAGLTGDNLPWTGTSNVTLTFNYPQTKDLVALENIWLRLRAVRGTPGNTVLDNSAALTPKAYVGVPENPVVPANNSAPGTVSVAGSWEFSDSGEVEDYLLDVSGPARGTDDYFSLAAKEDYVDIDILEGPGKDLADSIHEDGVQRTSIDKSSVIFRADQPNNGADTVVVGADRKTATIAGKGTYSVLADGKVRFTPTPEFKDFLAKRAPTDPPIDLPSVNYAFTTVGAEGWRSVAGGATIRGTAPRSSFVTVNTTAKQEQTGVQVWNLNKQVCIEDSDCTLDANWVSADARIKGSHADTDTTALKYRLVVGAEKKSPLTDKLLGTVTITNDTGKNSGNKVDTVQVDVIKINVPDASDATCALTAADNAQLPLTIAHGDSKTLNYTCTRTASIPWPAGTNVRASIEIPTVGAVQRPETGLSPDATISVLDPKATRLTDSYLPTNRVSGSPTPTASDLTAKIQAATVGTNTLIPNSIEWQKIWDAPGHKVNFLLDHSQAYGAGDWNLLNTTTLCLSTDTTKCVSPNPDGKPLTSAATVTIEPKSKGRAILIAKTDYKNHPLSGSDFKIFSHNEATNTRGPEIADAIEHFDGFPDTFTTKVLDIGKTYWLVETRSPYGHNLLPGPVKFTLEESKIVIGDKEQQGSIITADTNTITVKNVEIPVMPVSGSTGPLPYYAIGAVLLLCAAFLTHRRWRASN